MKKVLCFALSVVMILLMCNNATPANADVLKLSELSEADAIAFLKEKGVAIPDDYEDELMWGSFVKEIIACVEQNPSVELSFNYSVTHLFANEIKRVVNEYYGVESTEQTGNLSRVVPATLLYSTVCGDWDEAFERYNCYSYAIGITDDWLDPGNKSGFVYTVNLSVYTVAEYVMADLEELGNTNISDSDTLPDTTGWGVHQKAICVRIKGGVDYHFMKLDGSDWYHKPSNTNILKYNYIPTNDNKWTNERVYRGDVYLATLEYNSNIRYITYTEPHTITTTYTAARHTKTCTVCGWTETELHSYVMGSNKCTGCAYIKDNDYINGWKDDIDTASVILFDKAV